MLMNGLDSISDLTEAAKTVEIHDSISLKIWGDHIVRFPSAADALRQKPEKINITVKLVSAGRWTRPCVILLYLHDIHTS